MGADTSLNKIQEIRPIRENSADDLFLCYATKQEKCRGVVSRFSEYNANQAYVLFDSKARKAGAKDNIHWLSDQLKRVSNAELLETERNDPLTTVRVLRGFLPEDGGQCTDYRLTIDITSFSKNELLLLLRLLDSLGLLKKTRLLYTEPANYEIYDSRRLPPGIKQVTIVPTFKSVYDSQQELFLVIFLGYEGDRALATWENIEPNKTFAIIPRPAYHPEWEGRTEQLNAALLAALDLENVRYVHSQDPYSTYRLLSELIPENGESSANWYVSPLGTKLQIVGLYYFISQRPYAVSVVDSKPYGGKETVEYASVGIGTTWLLPGPPP